MDAAPIEELRDLLHEQRRVADRTGSAQSARNERLAMLGAETPLLPDFVIDSFTDLMQAFLE